MKSNHSIVTVVSASMLLSLAGCFSLSTSSEGPFTKSGIPHSRYLVGGGFSIEYIAPANGTAYWVEETTEKLLQTKSLNSGDKADFGDGMDPDSVKQALGIDVKDAKFTLYFVPIEPCEK
jgi:hypothetical protein